VIPIKIVTALCLGAMLCKAQTINISGVVQDAGGVGIAGCTVTLENASISTTTGVGGTFILTGSATPATQFGGLLATNARKVLLRNGKISVTLVENSAVGIVIYDVRGRLIYSDKKVLGTGSHVISLPIKIAGICVCNVTIGHDAYSFKISKFSESEMQPIDCQRVTSSLARKTDEIEETIDVIKATSPGMLNYQCAIEKFDTSGVVIKMIANAGDAIDADGNVYQSVRIGNQIWTVENLRTTRLNDGTVISSVTDSSIWMSLTTPGRCWYYNDSVANHAKFGVLYNWHVVKTRKLAPEGWRVPTDEDWKQLEEYLIANGNNYDGATSGNKIAKSMGAQTDWKNYGIKGTIGNDLSKSNTTGFSALPSGDRGSEGTFSDQSLDGCSWWSATAMDASYAWGRSIYFYSKDLFRHLGSKYYGLSVRLLRE
jgi:uncharacterized protein (TIGR02145 family)